jgi:hypothetical protein
MLAANKIYMLLYVFSRKSQESKGKKNELINDRHVLEGPQN